MPTGYNATAINTINLSAGEERAITGNIDVPHAKSSGKVVIGSLVMKDGNNVEQDRLTIEQHTKNQLVFDRIKVDYTDVDGNHQSDSFKSGDTSPKLDNSVRPGSELTFVITYKNNFDGDYDSDKSVIEDITLEIDPSDSDLFSDEPDSEVDLSDLDANKKDEYSFTSTVDDSIEGGNYDVDFNLQGTDGENFDHTESITLKLEVERQRNDVRITKSEIETPIESCDKELSLSIELQNFGTRDQKYVGFALVSSELGINYQVNDILLEKFDDADTYNQNVAIPITKIAKEGTYFADLKVYYERNKLIDQEQIPIKIVKCGGQTESIESVTTGGVGGGADIQSTNSIGNTTGTSATTGKTSTTISTGTSTTTSSGTTSQEIQTTAIPTTSGQTVIQTIEEPYSTDDFFVGGLIIAIIVVVALIVVFFILLLR